MVVTVSVHRSLREVTVSAQEAGKLSPIVSFHFSASKSTVVWRAKPYNESTLNSVDANIQQFNRMPSFEIERAACTFALIRVWSHDDLQEN